MSGFISALRADLRSTGPNWLRRSVWNLKFHRKKYVSTIAPPSFVSEVLAHKPERVLDMGCGTSALLQQLQDAGWNGNYHGVDISAAAIGIARNRKIHSPYNASWTVDTIEHYIPALRFDAICFIESIYYINPQVFLPTLARYMGSLSPRGRMFVRVCNQRQHARYVSHIQKHYPEIRLMFGG